jgi:outer membrane protein TolC
VHGVGGYSRYQDDQRLSPATRNGELGAFSKDIFNADLVLSLPLYTGGRITNEIRASELLRQSAVHRLARTRDETVFNISSVFYSILGQRHVIESLEFSRKALDEHRKRVNDLIAAQKAAKVDLLRTEVRLADLDQRIVRERNTLAIQQQVLLNLMGVGDIQGHFDVQGELASSEAKVSLEESMGAAQAQRSDYLSAQAAYEAQARRVDVARGGHWPTVSLRGGYGGRGAGHASDAAAGTDRFEDVGTVGVFIDIPLFEGGRVSAQVRQEQARLRAAQERLRKLELQVTLDVQSAVSNVTSARERVAATEKAIEQAKESLRVEQEKYALVKGSITDVLDAQTALLEAQTSYYRALADYNIAIAQLRLARGEKS